MNKAWIRALIALTAFASCIAASPPPSAQPLVVALGDSITFGHGLPSPATQNYAALYTEAIGGRLVNLGQPGYGCGDVLANEVPQMPLGAAIVIVNCGINDVGGFDFTPPATITRATAATAKELAGFEAGFATLLASVRAKEPNAAIYLVNLRHWQGIDGHEPSQFASDVDAWNAMLVATHLRVIDICDDARMYDLANFLPDEIHPNITGQQALASDFTGAPLKVSRRCGGL